MIDSVVTFKWRPRAGYRSTFTSQHVNKLFSGFARNYPKSVRYICITDDPVGLDAHIETVPIWDTFANIRNPTWPQGPSCYRRLLTFGKEFRTIAGDRFLCTDIDVVFTGDLTSIVEREEDFVIWGTSNPRIPYCASMYMMTAGAKSEVLERFDPSMSPRTSHQSGYFGSDQAWINYCLGAEIPVWNKKDGVYSYRDHIMKGGFNGRLPMNAKAVIFHGKPDPWESTVHTRSPWIREHHR